MSSGKVKKVRSRDFFGNRVTTRYVDGRKVGTTTYGQGLLGDKNIHRGPTGQKVGYTKDGQGLLGDKSTRHRMDGQVVGYTKHDHDWMGRPRAKHFTSSGSPTGPKERKEWFSEPKPTKKRDRHTSRTSESSVSSSEPSVAPAVIKLTTPAPTIKPTALVPLTKPTSVSGPVSSGGGASASSGGFFIPPIAGLGSLLGAVVWMIMFFAFLDDFGNKPKTQPKKEPDDRNPKLKPRNVQIGPYIWKPLVAPPPLPMPPMFANFPRTEAVTNYRKPPISIDVPSFTVESLNRLTTTELEEIRSENDYRMIEVMSPTTYLSWGEKKPQDHAQRLETCLELEDACRAIITSRG